MCDAKHIWVVGVSSVLAGAVWADPPRLMRDTPLDASYLRTHAATRGFLLGRPVRPKPAPDGKAVLFLRSQARVPKLGLFEFDVATGKTRELLTPEQVLRGTEEKLSAEEKARRERMRISVGGFTDFQLSEDGELILLSLSGRLYLVTRATGKVQELNTGRGTLLDPKFSPDGKSVGYVLDHDVHVLDLATQKQHRVTTGGSERLTHGLAEFVAQEEMGRFSGWWWSPDGKLIVYEEADAGGVEVWYVADPVRPEHPAHPSFYPRPGKANVKVRLGVVPVAGGETTWIAWNAEKYPYLAQVRWDKHGPLTVTLQSREQTELTLLRVDPATGQTTPLVVEKDPAWVNLHQEVPRWLPDGRGFLWVSEDRTGPHLALHAPDGRLRHRLAATAGYRGLVSVDAAKNLVWFLASADAGDPKGGAGKTRAWTGQPDPTRVDLCFVNLDREQAPSGWAVPGSRGHGVQGGVFARNHSCFVLTTTMAGELPRSRVHRADGTLAGELPSVAEEPDFKPRVEIQEIVASSGKFFTALVRPHGFDPKRKYPVVVDVYGGPGHLHVVDAMRNWLMDQWLADQGFIVVAIDGRGTPGRGRDWERAISKRFGSVPLDDQVRGLQALGAKYPELDLKRVGIVGWSFGGYMSALAVLRRPDVFQAAVAGAPVVDWLDYDTHYTERYLGLPDKDAGAYREASLLTYAAELKRPLLLVHGTADDNVYFRHTLKLVDALFRAGKDFEVLPLSGLTHMVPDPVVTERLWSRVAQHFRKHLAAPGDHR